MLHREFPLSGKKQTVKTKLKSNGFERNVTIKLGTRRKKKKKNGKKGTRTSR